MRLLVAIPALNEQSTIASAISDVRLYLPESEILVINDGSTDRTQEIVESLNVKCLNFPFNMGVGAAMRAAFTYAHREGFTQVLQFDADGQHKASEGMKLVKQSPEVAIVIGTRFLNSREYQVGRLRRLTMKILASVLSRRLRCRLTDVTSGFRLTRNDAIKFFSLNYPPEYLGDTVESLLLAGSQGFKITEVQVTMNQRQGGNPSQGIFKLVAYLLRVISVVVTSFLHHRKKH
jgi:glycosyltransferase involved in cell wall biosynthesis